jgi:hypothetical protein
MVTMKPPAVCSRWIIGQIVFSLRTWVHAPMLLLRSALYREILADTAGGRHFLLLANGAPGPGSTTPVSASWPADGPGLAALESALLLVSTLSAAGSLPGQRFPHGLQCRVQAHASIRVSPGETSPGNVHVTHVGAGFVLALLCPRTNGALAADERVSWTASPAGRRSMPLSPGLRWLSPSMEKAGAGSAPSSLLWLPQPSTLQIDTGKQRRAPRGMAAVACSIGAGHIRRLLRSRALMRTAALSSGQAALLPVATSGPICLQRRESTSGLLLSLQEKFSVVCSAIGRRMRSSGATLVPGTGELTEHLTGAAAPCVPPQGVRMLQVDMP